MVGVDVATGRKYELRGDDLLQCYEIYAVLKAEQDVGMYICRQYVYAVRPLITQGPPRNGERCETSVARGPPGYDICSV